MKAHRSCRFVAYFAVLLGGLAALTPLAAARGEESRASPLGELPLIFVENQGQWDDAARFVARKGPLAARFEAGALVLARRDGSGGEIVRLAFEGASSTAWIEGEDPIRGVHNFLVGEPSLWRTHVPGYGSLVYRGLYDGIDLRLRDRDGRLEYDVLLERAADLEQVIVRCDGVHCLEIDSAGNLVLTTALGELIQAPPVTWQVLPNGEHRPVECLYRRIDAQRYGFEVPDSEPALPMVVDPGLQWATYLGDSGFDLVRDVVIAADGTVVACGYTSSSNFPTQSGAFATSQGGDEGFIVRMDPEKSGTAQLVYATYLGGTDNDYANSISIDAQGVLTVVGGTYSTNFPTTAGAYQTTTAGGGFNDVFVCRLDPDQTGSNQLLYSTFIGGSSWDGPDDHRVDAGGIVTMVGRTKSNDFPTTSGVFGPIHNGGEDIFVCRLDPDETGPNQLVYSSYLGGSGDEHNNVYDHLVVDDLGLITVAGRTGSTDFPVKPNPGAYQIALAGGMDGFVSRIDPNLVGGAQLVASTYLGGSDDESLQAVSVDASGVVTVGGWTYSADYPTTPGAYQSVHANPNFRDCFFTRLDPGLTTLVASTFLGGLGWEYVTELDDGGSGLTTAIGTTVSDNLPGTLGAYQPVKSGFGDAFLCRFDPYLKQLLHYTFLGGANGDLGMTMAMDHELAVIAGGRTISNNFPTTANAFDTTWTAGNYDGFLAKLDLMPTGVQPYGASTSGCKGPMAMAVTKMPKAGAGAGDDFGFLCSNAPPFGVGVLIIGVAQWSPPVPLVGVDAWVDLVQLNLMQVDGADGAGYAETPTPIPDKVKPGVRIYAQYFWLPDPCGPQGFSTSNALDVTVQ